MNEDLKIIKKKYGEKMAHFCREFFPTLLEREGLLSNLMLQNFEPNHSLYADIIKQNKENVFKDFIYSLVDDKDKREEKVLKSPKELLEDVGYDLYECKREEDIQKFKKYYARGEELCTFRGNRLESCHVFFAVKKNADNIKREDFSSPERQDAYGTSVISIQFTRDESHTLSIKNRYNHTVNNPDSTYSNNLDNIIPGLTASFAKYYGLIQQHPNSKFELNGYVRANDNKYYKYNQEIMNVYYCPNNIIIDNYEVQRYDKEKYIIFDYFILDLVKKKVRVYETFIKDSFVDTVSNIEKIEIKRKEETKKIKIILEGSKEILIVLDKDNQIIKLENQNIKEVGDDFLASVFSLQELNMPNLEKVGKYFLSFGNVKKLNLPKLQKADTGFLNYNLALEELDLPVLKEVGSNFLSHNRKIKQLNMPCLQRIGNNFLYFNDTLKKLILPEITEVGNDFLYEDCSLEELSLPKLQRVGDYFLYRGILLKKLSLPSLKRVGSNFLKMNVALKELDLPSLEKFSFNFLDGNKVLRNKFFSTFKMDDVNFLENHSIVNCHPKR